MPVHFTTYSPADKHPVPLLDLTAQKISLIPRHFEASYSYEVQRRLNNEEMRFLEAALDGAFKSASEMMRS